MFTSRDLKATITEVRPIVERQLDDAALIASFRESVTAKGGDWSQVKALVKAMIQDERDEAGGHKRVLAILHKADNALGYADMLGLGNLNEKNSFEGVPDHDPITGEIHEPQPTMAAQTAGSETAVANSTPGSGAGTVDAGEANWPSEMTTASPANEPETIPPVADPATVVSEAGDDRSTGTASATVVAFRINPKTHFANSKGLPRLHGCLKPEACGGSHRSLCFGCSVQHDGPAHQEGAA
jgi:hypothetical protein